MMRTHAFAVGLLLVGALTRGLAGPVPMESAKPEAKNEARTIAEQFIGQWAKANQLKSPPISWEPIEIGFGHTCTGWNYQLESVEPAVFMFVSARQKLVLSFSCYDHFLSTPNWKDGVLLSNEQQVAEVRKLVRVPAAKAQSHARSFAATVYPRFSERDFELVKAGLVVRTDASYEFRWRERFDTDRPTTYPNELFIAVNPKTGIICEYEAENYSLPDGFKIGMTRKQAFAKANGELQKQLTPGTKLLSPPTMIMRYLSSRDGKEPDRVVWSFRADLYDGFTSIFERRYDVMTGEQIATDEEAEPE